MQSINGLLLGLKGSDLTLDIQHAQTGVDGRGFLLAQLLKQQRLITQPIVERGAIHPFGIARQRIGQRTHGLFVVKGLDDGVALTTLQHAMAHKPDQPVHRIDLVRRQRGKTLGLRRDGVQIIVGALCHAVSRQGGQLRGVFGQGIGQGQGGSIFLGNRLAGAAGCSQGSRGIKAG